RGRDDLRRYRGEAQGRHGRVCEQTAPATTAASISSRTTATRMEQGPGRGVPGRACRSRCHENKGNGTGGHAAKAKEEAAAIRAGFQAAGRRIPEGSQPASSAGVHYESLGPLGRADRRRG